MGRVERRGHSQCLTLLGTASIQGYLFQSNLLRENLGASHQVKKALEEWNRRHDGEIGEVLFVGGGRAALIFSSRPEAEAAVWAWSRRWLDEAPGMRLNAHHREFGPGELKNALRAAERSLSERENRPPFGAPLGALPVVQPCPASGYAAELWHRGRGEWISGETYRKRSAVKEANEAFENAYRSCLLGPNSQLFEFPAEFAALGQQEGASHIAVVHADGNGVGEILRRVAEQAGKGLEGEAADKALVEGLKKVSKTLTDLAQAAFKTTLEDLTQRLPKPRVPLWALGDPTTDDGVKRFPYPVRPLVDGGDDLTFVCQGRLGLWLALQYLRVFEEESKKRADVFGEDLTACAGVAIVGEKFPFSRAYELAEALASNAKRRRRECAEGGSWLDFEIIREGLTEPLENLRKRKYEPRKDERLDCRPYRIGDAGDGPESWESCQSILKGFQDDWPRSRAKRLMEELANGRKRSSGFLRELESRNITLPGASGRDAWEEVTNRRWQTRYYDPLDALDFYVEPTEPAEDGDVDAED